MDITKEIKAWNMTSNNGNVVPNQIIIEDKKRKEVIFQSYGTTIAKKITNNNISNIVLDENYWDYSRTTLKYLTKFIFDFMHIATNTKEIRKHIKDGNIKLSNLN